MIAIKQVESGKSTIKYTDKIESILVNEVDEYESILELNTSSMVIKHLVSSGGRLEDFINNMNECILKGISFTMDLDKLTIKEIAI